MSWARLDDDFHAHPRTLQAGLEANGLFCRAISYCAHYRTDGFVPAEWLEIQGGAQAAKRAIKRLADVGLIEGIEGGYIVTGYLERNFSRDQIKARKAADAARKAAERAAMSERNPSGVQSDSNGTGGGHG